MVRGRSISAMMGSALYAACRETETPRTLKDVAEIMNIKKGEFIFEFVKFVEGLYKIPFNWINLICTTPCF